MTNILLEEAIKYAERGWFVFPTRECNSKPYTDEKGKIRILKSKSPYLKGGFQSATTDRITIQEWWKKFPNAGIGVSCGHSNLVVVDIDTKNGRKGFDNFMKMNVSDEGALHSITPSGGAHIIYSGSMDSHANVKTGVDLRSRGTYFLVPPSQIELENGTVGKYFRLDDWDRIPADVPLSLAEKLNMLKGKDKSEIRRDKVVINECLDKTVERVRIALERMPQEYCDEYFRWVEIGMALKTLGDKGFELWNNWSKRSSKYDEDACVYRWDKFSPRDIGLGSIFYWVKEGNDGNKR